MKWLKDIKANTRPWLAFLSGSAANTSDEPDDTAIINQYFATYLQNVAADRIVYSDSEIPSARSNRPSVTIELTHLNER